MQAFINHSQRNDYEGTVDITLMGTSTNMTTIVVNQQWLNINSHSNLLPLDTPMYHNKIHLYSAQQGTVLLQIEGLRNTFCTLYVEFIQLEFHKSS